MPILVGVITPSPPPPPPPPPVEPPVVIPPPSAQPLTRTSVVWVAPDGSELPLTGDGTAGRGVFIDVDGFEGLGAADVAIQADPSFGGGSSVRHVRVDPGQVMVPMHVWDDDPLGFIEWQRQVTTAFTQTKRLGVGRFVVIRPGGEARSLRAYYQSGLDPAHGRGQGLTRVFAALGLYCPDPYFRSEVRESRRGQYEVPRDYLNPYMTVSAAQALGELTVDYHDGDVETWPRWTFTPPWTRLEIRNRTTGKGFVVSAGSTATTLTVDTDPTAPRVVASDGTNWMPHLDWPGATLFPLEPGENALTVQMDGAAPGSSWEMSFYRRYETA